MNGIPLGWEVISVQDLGNWTGGGTPSKSNSDYWVEHGIPWVSPKDMKSFFISDTQDHISDEAVEESATRLVPEGSILVVTRSGILAHTLPVAKALCGVAINQDLKALVPADELEPDYILYAFRNYQNHILSECGKAGTTVANLDTERFLAFRIPLPPHNEQGRIVAKLDSLLARTRQACEELENIPTLIEHYKQAILAAAFCGELTADWREETDYEPASVLLERILEERRARWEAEQLATYEAKGKTPPKNWQDKYQEPESPDTSDLPDLPEGWVWATPDQIAAYEDYSLAIGPFGSNLKVSDYTNEGVPLVFVRNIRSGNFEDDNLKFVAPEKADELIAHHVEGGDILITKMGDPPGDAIVYPFHLPTAVITADCIKIRLTELLGETEYFVHATHSPMMQSQILKITRGVAQLKMSLGRFKTLSYPVAPIHEQQLIVTSIEEAFEWLDAVLEESTHALRLLDHLERSILAQAFRGKLVPQDRNDEPASVLLERIREARAAQSNGSGRKKRKS